VLGLQAPGYRLREAADPSDLVSVDDEGRTGVGRVARERTRVGTSDFREAPVTARSRATAASIARA
jgi:hypothetical protein